MYKENGRNYYYVDWTKDEKGFSQGGRRFPITIEIRNLLSEINLYRIPWGLNQNMYFAIGKGDGFTQKHIQIVYGHYVEAWDFR